jgi:GR25 family glycosyltransferase involved in LPS biosynthesis
MLVSRNVWLALSVAGAFCFLVITVTSLATFRDEQGPIPRFLRGIEGQSYPHSRDNSDVHNRTLGFQKVFAIGLPTRTDKRDLLDLAASVTGIDVTWLPGVLYEDVNPKAIAEGWKSPYFPGASRKEAGFVASWIGSWRAHMNALEHIIEHNIETALILEDDCDWDVRLKQQLSYFAEGSKAMQEATVTGTTSLKSPYGNHWDVLWLGHRRVGPDNSQQPVFVMTNDTTVPRIEDRHTLWRQNHIPDELMAPNTRLIVRTKHSTGSFAYAVTLSSARKILASLADNTVVYDVALSNVCQEAQIRPVICYAPYPPILSAHRMAGSANRNSDIDANVASDAKHVEETWDAKYSTMMNIKGLVAGEREVYSQWPQAGESTLDADEPLLVRGELQSMTLGDLEEKWHPRINGKMPAPSSMTRARRESCGK